MRILLVEDEPDVADVILEILQDEGYAVDLARTAAEAEELAAVEEYDLFLLDRILPDSDGLDLCRLLRRSHPSLPILMLTALSDPEFRVEGLDAGADDYLGKPFHGGELPARIRALLRRGGETRQPQLRYGELTLDPARRDVRVGGRKIVLYPKEYAVLEYLMRNPQRVVTQEQIGEHVWGDRYDPHSNMIESYISRLRKKLESSGCLRMIHTIKGVGYIFGEEQ